MPKTPDFGPVVRGFVAQLRPYFMDVGIPAHEARQNELLDQMLVAVWNARGAADEDAVFAELRGPTPECLRAAGAIRILDR